MTIGSSVSSIGNAAFGKCNLITSFNVDAANANYSAVDGLILSTDGKSLVQGVNGNVVVPNEVTSIEDYAFDGCGGLTSVTMGNSVTSIGESSFS